MVLNQIDLAVEEIFVNIAHYSGSEEAEISADIVYGGDDKATLKIVIFSSAQRRCLLSIMNIISTANQCLLYSHYNDPEKIPFNNYVIQIIPILNKFYDKLVDLRLPNQLNEYLSHSFEGMEDNSFVFGAKKKSNEKKK